MYYKCNLFAICMCLYVIFFLYLRAPLVCMFLCSFSNRVYVTLLLWAFCVAVSAYISLEIDTFCLSKDDIFKLTFSLILDVLLVTVTLHGYKEHLKKYRFL
jgi:hypothetical protein